MGVAFCGTCAFFAVRGRKATREVERLASQAQEEAAAARREAEEAMREVRALRAQLGLVRERDGLEGTISVSVVDAQ